jgi:hypothetical protein
VYVVGSVGGSDAEGGNPLRGRFNPTQVERLLRPIKPGRVFQTDGHANLAAWDVVAHLTRMFGFGGWGKEILSIDLVSEGRGEDLGYKGKPNWYVTYRCLMRLRVFDPDGRLAFQTDDGATGSAQNQPQLGDAHDLAYKNAVSYALKRCAKDLGDQFGLSLYRNGSTDTTVGLTLVGAPDVPAGQEPEIVVSDESDLEDNGRDDGR